MRYSDASSSSNDSKEWKDKQKLKRSLSDTDLQRNIDHFKQNVIYKLSNLSIKDTSESIAVIPFDDSQFLAD